MCVLALWIGFFGLMMTFSEIIQRKIYEVNENCRFNKNYANIYDDFGDLIRFHTEIKELSDFY